jgi:RNA polymerase sigma factor, sigma-70 family
MLTLSGNESLAEELTQQTFYQAFLHIDRFEGRSSLYTWLCKLGKNEWLMECRKKKSISYDLIGDLVSEADPEAIVIRHTEQRLVQEAILRLPTLYRDVLIYRTYGDLTFAEIADIFEKTESWAKVTYFRGKEKLKLELEDRI